MNYLLDTCALSEFTKPRPDARLVAWFRDAAEESLFVGVLTLGELEQGVQRLPAGKRRDALRAWLNAVGTRFESRLLAVTAEIALDWGRVCAKAAAEGRPLPVIDALIGSTARVFGLTVVTHDTSDIARTGAPVLDPWRA